MPVLAAVAGGGLYALGYIGAGVWPCLFGFLMPLWWALERASRRSAIGLGLVFGLTAYAGGFSWLWYLVAAFLAGQRWLGAVLWLGYGVWFAGGFAVYAATFRHLRARGWPVAMAGVPPLLVVEWLQPQLFPVNAGSGLVVEPALIQPLDLGGPLLLSALVGAANVAAYETWRWGRGRRARPTAIWCATVVGVAAVLGYGRVRSTQLAATISAAPALRVGVVQANLALMEKRTQSLLGHQRHVEQTRELLADGPLDLVVWPETAYVRGLRRPLPLSGRLIVEDLAVPLLFGAPSVWEADGRLERANSAFLVGADGMIRDAYDKNLLIPFAERVPFGDRFPSLARWFPNVEAFDAATTAPSLRLGPWRISTPICYEAVRPDFVRRMVREGRPHLLVSLANDAWFGRSQEPRLHLALAQLRAVEHRRFLVRATNSGISAIVDPTGRVVAQTRLFTRENLRGVVHPLDGSTVYGRFGDWAGWASVALTALAAVARRDGGRT